MAKATTKLVTPIIQAHLVQKGEKLKEVWVHNRYMFSSVAQFAIELFKQEMATEEPVVAMPMGGTPTFQARQRTTVENSVQRSCDGAEKLYAEMIKRGWVQEMPEIDECIDRDGYVNFGMHGGGHRGKDQAG
jgi:hypothetical protein